ncbi:MAG: hypothetical protein GXO74_05975 [Calditrichaeota bacterium]|nr:hypothetical protein [Calditrichota bacterium]
MARLRRRKNTKKNEKDNNDDDLLISDFQFGEMLSKKQLELELQHLRLEIKLNDQIRRLIDRQMDELIKQN